LYTPKILEWDDALGTGNETLDNQHKYLIETLNNLGTSLLKGDGAKITTRILGRLRFYAEWHFEQEEECFDKYNCPAGEMNKNAHTAFIEKFDRFQKNFDEDDGSTETALKIHEEITDWIVNHIMRVDGQLYPCIHHRPKPSVK